MASWDADALVELRAAAFRRDGAAGFAVLRNRPLAPVLQFAGDLLADALREARTHPGQNPLGAQREDVEALARKCVEALEGRDAVGDALLAETLREALDDPSGGPARHPRDAVQAVPVDLGALAYALAEGDAVTILDLCTGDLLAEDELDDLHSDDIHSDDIHSDDIHSDGDRRLKALYRDTASAHDDMHVFAESEPDTPAPMRDVHAYTEALAGTRLEFAWSLFREERQRGRARQWLADNGLEAAPRRLL
ncbi:hypothetical protein AB0J52_27280 [Spirillospora sp. NPDC049652]